jgi:predicted Zn-dependent protease
MNAARLMALALALATAACAQFGATGGAPAPQSTVVPSSAPRLVGAETPESRQAARIVSAYGGLYSNTKLEALLDTIVPRLAKAAGRPAGAFHVSILNSPTINAFSLPSGDLYITRGMIALANDSSEVAAVVGHEMGHVIARHAFARADRERQAVLVSKVMTDVLNDPEGGALALAKSKIALARFSRDQELQADKISVGLLAQAGYDPFAMPRILTDMQRNGALRNAGAEDDGASRVDFLSNHPSTPQRVELANQEAHAVAGHGQRARDRAQFLDAVEGMVYGDDPVHGFIRGSRFYQPVLGFFFQAPPGYVLENTADAVIGINPDGSALRLDAVKAPGDQSLADHLRADLMDGIAVSDVQTKEIGGIPAAVAVAHGHDWDFRLAALRLDGEVYRLVFAVKQLTPQVDATLMRSIDSFRHLTPDEITAARPQRIAVVRVQAGDTVASLAARMAVENPTPQRFMVLNGLTSASQLTPGMRVKLVVQ